MAEGFANLYGKDVLIASSAGLAPTEMVARETVECMREKSVDLSTHFPKKFEPFAAGQPDIIINMSGFDLPPGPETVTVQNWFVRDPYSQSEKIYRESRDHIERLVMQLILQLRRESRTPQAGTPAKSAK
jgi:protein-tyrosine-phosphatase